MTSAGKRILRWTVGIVGGLVSVVVVAYLVLVAINWRDRPPSETAQRFAALYRDRPPVADTENGFVYLQEFALARSGPRLLPDACRSGSPECSAILEKIEPLLDQQLGPHQGLLDLYGALLQRSGWRETVPTDPATPLPPFAGVMQGQELLLLKAYVLAGQKNAAGVRQFLTHDVRFWRRVLASSDILITKMIAVAALNRHFVVGNLILRRLPAELQMSAMPEEWRVPMTDDERSMLRTFVGEWIYGQGLLRKSVESLTWTDRLTIGLYQEQDTSNRRAEMLAVAAAQMHVPFHQLPKALADMQRHFDDPMSDTSALDWLYNPGGKLLLLVGASAYGPYGARVSDIEGARRAAVLATELRSQHPTSDGVSAALSASDTRSPYDDLPFAWDDEQQSIVFIGLQQGEPARHAFMY